MVEKLKKIIGDSKNVYLTLDKAEEFNSRLVEVTEDKTVLEEQYFTMRTKYRSNQLQMDDAMAKAEHFQELLEILKNSKQSDLSDRLIALSEKVQNMRLNEMRAVRELNEFKEKSEYISRLLRTSNENVKKYEEKVAEYESRMLKKEEEFRRADNERMRKFFNARYDDIPAAFNNDHHQPVFPQPSGRYGGRNNNQDDIIPPSSLPSNPIMNSSGGGGGTDTKYLEGVIKKQKVEMSKMLDEIRSKDALINRFKEWQLADKYLQDDEKVREAIEGTRVKVDQVHEQEAKEMAEAAAQMVKTLQEMLE